MCFIQYGLSLKMKTFNNDRKDKFYLENDQIFKNKNKFNFKTTL